jgi:hypothetical protein
MRMIEAAPLKNSKLTLACSLERGNSGAGQRCGRAPASMPAQAPRICRPHHKT